MLVSDLFHRNTVPILKNVNKLDNKNIFYHFLLQET